MTSEKLNFRKLREKVKKIKIHRDYWGRYWIFPVELEKLVKLDSDESREVYLIELVEVEKLREQLREHRRKFPKGENFNQISLLDADENPRIKAWLKELEKLLGSEKEEK